MPINEISGFTPLSQAFTHQDIVSRALIKTGQADNEMVQLDNARQALRQAISYISDLLNLAEKPDYGCTLQCSLETTEDTHTRLEWIDLSQPYTLTNGKIVIPSNYIYSIKRVSFVPTSDALLDMQPTDWAMNATRKDVSELTWLLSQNNTEYRQSICWTQFGNKIYFYIGNNIKTPVRATRSAYVSVPYDVSQQIISVFFYRKPVLDNMFAPNSIDAQANYALDTGSIVPNMTAYIDISDQYTELVTRMVQKSILEQLKSSVPAELENEINTGISLIKDNLDKELKMEAEEYDKMRYGLRQRNNP